MQIASEAIVLACRYPRSDGVQQSGAHGVLVEWNRYRVEPAHDLPDAAFEIGGLAGKQAEEDLRGSAFDSHGLLPLEITGACSSTSRSERMGAPVGNKLAYPSCVAGRVVERPVELSQVRGDVVAQILVERPVEAEHVDQGLKLSGFVHWQPREGALDRRGRGQLA